MYSVFCVTWNVWQQILLPLFPILSSDSSEDFVDNRQVWLSSSRRGLSSLQTVRQWALVQEKKKAMNIHIYFHSGSQTKATSRPNNGPVNRCYVQRTNNVRQMSFEPTTQDARYVRPCEQQSLASHRLTRKWGCPRQEHNTGIQNGCMVSDWEQWLRDWS